MDLLEDMLTFVKVVEAQSFTGAATRLGVAKSVVSRRIGELEGRFGVNLFHRTTRRLSTTEIGQAYYERAQRILADVAEAETAVRSLQVELIGKLRIAAPMSFGILHLAPAIIEFLQRHKELEIELNLNDRTVDLVSEGFDLAIRIGHLKDSTLIARTLAPSRRIMCASPDYLARKGIPNSPGDLFVNDHDCLLYTNRPVAEQWQFPDFGKDTRTTGRRLAVNNGDVLRQAALAGLGLVVLPTFLVSTQLSRGELIHVLTEYDPRATSIYALWSPNRQLSAKVRTLVDFLAERFGPRPYWDEAIDVARLRGQHPSLSALTAAESRKAESTNVT